MKLMLRYMAPYRFFVYITVGLKFIAVIMELFIPYILEYLIDVVAPVGRVRDIVLYGCLMIILAVFVVLFNIIANRIATASSRDAVKEMRKELFHKTIHLSGACYDEVSLPSLISRMTSDVYNVQSFLGMIQRMGVRAPIMLIGAIVVAGLMDSVLMFVLVCMLPILGLLIFYISKKGIPMFALVGESVDHIVRLMRENITGVRVIRALSQVNHEMERFQQGNHSLTKQDSKAGMTMALPNPVMNLFLNLGLTLIILIGAYRVNMGLMKTGVILAFLTYFNMILQAVMGINRIFILYSKAGASANRIDEVLHLENPFKIQDNYLEGDKKDVVRFNNVTFSYHVSSAGQRNALQSISFCIKEGGSLGIIGSTGSGKSTIMNLLMRRYEVTQGDIYVNGSNICTLPFEQLRNKMGVVLQNDTIFQDSILENITLGRELSLSEVKWAATCAGIAEHIESLPNTYEYRVSIKGMNLSGGQRQRLLLARALAGRPEILILDDSSSALDYVTEANLRNNLKVMYQSCAQIIIAQRISSVRDLDQILVLEDGEAVGLDTHEVLLETCEIYRDIYRSQMGEELGGDLLCHR